MKTDNAITCLLQFARLLHVPITSNSIHQELEKHPDYPSFLALSDVLNNWRIPNGALQIDAKELISVPVPFIAHLSIGEGEFAVVDSVDDECISILNERQGKSKFTIEEHD